MKKLAIVTSHPIQYNAPLFKMLASGGQIEPMVFYTWEQSSQGKKYDPDFGRDVQWDIPLLDGYNYRFVRNTARDPGTHHYRGIVNPTLNEELSAWGPDALLVMGWSFVSHIQALRYFHGKVPVLFRGDSTLLDEHPGLRRVIRRRFLRWVYGHVDYALYTGCNNKQYFLRHGLRDDQLVLAPHAIDNERFAEPDAVYRKEADKWRQQLDIGPEELVVLFAGKLEPKKNPFFLTDLTRWLPKQGIRIVVIGNGVLEAELKQRAQGDPRVLFLDFQNQSRMPVAYRLGDLFILPSQGPGETWGLAANEAMASGCAVLLSEKAGGAVDLVKDGVNGFRFALDDGEKCAGWIRALAADRERLNEMKAASKKIIRDFSYDRVVTAIEQIIFQIK
jgi:glycosyltransferase involved in cell wall biosynthesis